MGLTVKNRFRDLGDQEQPVKYTALLQLSGLSSDEAIEFKAGWPSVPDTRRREILAKMADLCEDNLELDFSAVFRAALDDVDEQVRETATLGLWECEDRAIIRPLIALLTEDPSAKVRASAGVSLRNFATMAQSGKLLSRDADRIREALMGVIGRPDQDLEVKRRAIEALACFDFPETDQIIREAYASGEPKLKQSSIHAMGQSCNPQWLPTVLDEFDDEDAAIRYEAANACGQLADESTVPHLIRLIRDEDAQVQLAAVKAIGAVGGPLAKRALEQCLKMDDEALEEVAQDALGNIEFDGDPLG